MKILLLGTRGVGKTTLIHSMYGYFQEGRRFTLSASNDRAEMLNVYMAIRRGRFPEPSSRRRQYDLSLSYAGTFILNFSWIDYQGTIYEDIPLAAADLQSLAEDMKRADAIICFFDQSQYSQNDQTFMVTAQNLSLLLGLLDGFGGYMPISFVVTKCDLRPRQFTKTELIAPLSEIINAISDNDHIYGALLPVACGEKEWNIDLPLLFVLVYGIILRHQHEYEKLSARLQELMNRSLFADIADWIDSRLSGYRTDYEILNSERESFNTSAQWRRYAVEEITKKFQHEITF